MNLFFRIDESFILSRQGGITKQFDLWLAGLRLKIVYADHVESPLARRWKTPQVLPCDCRNQPALVAVHCRLAGFDIARGSRLNFHKTKDVLVPPDQIDFSPAAWRAEIPCHHGVTQPPQVEICRPLPPSPGAGVFRNFVFRQSPLSQPVQKTEHSPRDPAGKRASKATGKHSDSLSSTLRRSRLVGCDPRNN